MMQFKKKVLKIEAEEKEQEIILDTKHKENVTKQVIKVLVDKSDDLQQCFKEKDETSINSSIEMFVQQNIIRASSTEEINFIQNTAR